ncbi:MAG: hypothetical protein HFH68_12280 [Lachnospiraceae bacterium]|nr:hypothetical protein [Lachnospiraceae bacterium]
MDYAIKILELERISIISALKNGQNEQLQELQQLDKALKWLHLLQDKKVDNAGRYNFEPLPFVEGYGGFTNYRIMIDKETEDVSLWEEYKKTDGSCFLLEPGDFILEAK